LQYETFPNSGDLRDGETGADRGYDSRKGCQYMPEQLMTLQQVAEYLNVDKFTVYRLLAEKQLPAFKVGNQWRFKRKLIENWLKKHSNVGRKDS